MHFLCSATIQTEKKKLNYIGTFLFQGRRNLNLFKLYWYLPVPGKKKLEFVAFDSFKMLGDRNHVSNVVALRSM